MCSVQVPQCSDRIRERVQLSYSCLTFVNSLKKGRTFWNLPRFLLSHKLFLTEARILLDYSIGVDSFPGQFLVEKLEDECLKKDDGTRKNKSLQIIKKNQINFALKVTAIIYFVQFQIYFKRIFYGLFSSDANS